MKYAPKLSGHFVSASILDAGQGGYFPGEKGLSKYLGR